MRSAQSLFGLVALSLAVIPSVFSAALSSEILAYCDSPRVVDTTYIGQDKNVKVETLHCDNIPGEVSRRDVEKRQANVCGATCNTNCFTPSGGGPDPNECHVITDALLYDSQNVGALFTMDPSNNTAVITMTYQSCESFIVDQAGSALQYCRTDWATVLDFLAFNCQSTQNAHGGNCVASDQRWFIQVNHS